MPAEAWESCGFGVAGGACAAGQVTLRLAPGDGRIASWAWTGLRGEPDAIDGLAIEPAGDSAPRVPNPNSVAAVDHVVVFTPELGRTIAAFEAAGVELRRLREPAEPGPPLRQAFFRPGEPIVEVVESPRAQPGPARFWGITFAVADLDAAAEALGERLGPMRDAVQPGRRIATVRREAGLGVPVALISRPDA